MKAILSSVIVQPAVVALLYGYLLFAPTTFVLTFLAARGDARSALSVALIVGSAVALLSLVRAAFHASKAEAPRPKLWAFAITVVILMVAGTIAAIVAVSASQLELKRLPLLPVTAASLGLIGMAAFAGRLLDRPATASDRGLIK